MIMNTSLHQLQARNLIRRTSSSSTCFKAQGDVCKRSLNLVQSRHTGRRSRSVIVRADGDNEELPWERRERLQKLEENEGKDLPFPVYLLGSAIIAIAAVGSIFEIINKNSIFGVLPPSNPLWLPILGIFAVTGLPSAGFLFLKAIKSANDDSDRQNKADGY